MKIFIYLSLLLMTLWLLVVSDSKTSLLCLIIGVSVLIMMESPVIKRSANLIGIYTFVTILVVFILQFTLEIVTTLIESLGRDATLTGRTEIWNAVMGLKTNLLIGVGYGSFWLGDRMAFFWEKYSWHPTETHNGYLEIYLELGIIGLSMVIGIIISAFRKINKTLITNYKYGAFQTTLLIIFLLYNITESAFRPGLLMYFIFMLAVVNVPIHITTQNHRVNSYS